MKLSSFLWNTAAILFIITIILYILPQLLIRLFPKQNILKRYGKSWVFVTGSSSGIGEEFAVQSAKMGMNVIIHGRNAERFAQVEKRIKEVNDLVEVKIIKADFGQNPQEAADEVLSQIGGLDISVYFANAGFAVPDNFATSNPEQIEMLNTNVVTHQHILNSMCPKICSRTPNTTSGKRGAILYTSSLNALVSFPGTAGYSATKSYMSSFAQCLALELKPRDVDVCVIQPGPVNTRFHARVGQEVTPSFQSPESASTLIFKSLGRFPSVDSGILTIIVRMLTKIVDANALTLILGKMAPNPPKQD